MKKVLLLLLLVTNFVVAQSSKKKDLVNKLTESTCECTAKKKVEAKKLKVTLGLCLLESVSDNKTEVFTIYNKTSIDS